MLRVLLEGRVLPAQLQRSQTDSRRTTSHSEGFPDANAASVVEDLLEMRELPRVDREPLHQKTWQGQSSKVSLGNGNQDFCFIPEHSIPIFAATELPARVLDLLQH